MMDLVEEKRHSKSIFIQNLYFLTPSSPLTIPVCFTCNSLPFSTYVRFSELPHSFLKKVPGCLWKLGVKKREKIIIRFKLNIKYENVFYTHIYIYIYIYINIYIYIKLRHLFTKKLYFGMHIYIIYKNKNI